MVVLIATNTPVPSSNTSLTHAPIAANAQAYASACGGICPTAKSISLDGNPVFGVIARRYDLDYYKIYLNNGTKYGFEMKGSKSSDASLEDPLLLLYNNTGIHTGNPYIRPDNNFSYSYNSKIRFVAEYDGFYFLTARAHGPKTGAYELEAYTIVPGSAIELVARPAIDDGDDNDGDDDDDDGGGGGNERVTDSASTCSISSCENIPLSQCVLAGCNSRTLLSVLFTILIIFDWLFCKTMAFRTKSGFVPSWQVFRW